MADLSINVSNTVRCFAGAPASLWNAYNWGAFLWGEGTADMLHLFEKIISEGVTSADAISQKTVYVVLPTQNLSVGIDVAQESLQDPAGYYRVFPDRVTDAEDRSFTSWTSAAAGAGSWSTAAATTTSWSDA